MGLLAKILRVIFRVPSEYRMARQQVSKYLMEQFSGRVAYGPFKGIRLDDKLVWWGDGDITKKLLGAYEKQILDKIVQLSAFIDGPFIDIGAADGYYVIGAVKSKLFDYAYAYEISPLGRKRLGENCSINGVSDRVFIDSEASIEKLKVVLINWPSAFVLIDIEGAEFELLDDSFLELLRTCFVVVELHPRMVSDGRAQEEGLVARASQHFVVHRMRSAGGCPDDFTELDRFSDYERVVSFSEGRGEAGRWILLVPRIKQRTLGYSL